MTTQKSNLLEFVSNELNDLNIKRAKLKCFLNSEKTKGIDPVQFSLLKIQLSAMKTYGKCLLERIIWMQKHG